ncbi:type VII toxin-antitoxin system HepT family RNase toxin [Tumebacillus permanentifrigoris]|uniref:Uncharacterized protein YutE (UPF0331/DUF86 family) n=1 Tax=Tumebacillus permanentifrigoris TaxID=378543 RepID=A0A316D6W4_9BACL|nr:DUF86 domain-containing protein [Tumebacillus permanentifrigoris]PWK11352.1 uncharacterized protein YutE (UPF0331/DUF86 family) [Tumebacillus permanentifrigoris]
MFITDSHRSQIRGYLTLMEQQFHVLQVLADHTEEQFLAQPILQAAGERSLHIALECLTDIGNLIIDALVMRDAASYEDIFEILTEEQVFTRDFYEHFIGAIRFRKLLAHEYLRLEKADVWHAVRTYAQDFATIRDSIATYVKLG